MRARVRFGIRVVVWDWVRVGIRVSVSVFFRVRASVMFSVGFQLWLRFCWFVLGLSLVLVLGLG